MDLSPPDEEEYTSAERAEAAVRRHALRHGYGISKAKIQFDKKKPPTIRRHDFRCAKGSKQRGEGVRRHTSTRMIECPFDVRVQRMEVGTWKVHVVDSTHNHRAVEPSALPQYRKPTESQKASIHSLHSSGVAPRYILAQILQRDSSSLITLRDIYNEIFRARKERLGDLTPIEALVAELDIDKDWAMHYITDDEGYIDFVFLAPSEAIDIARASLEIIFIDATYRTNRYNMLLIHFMAVTVIGRTASIGMCFVKSEVEPVYRQVVRTFKQLVMGNTKVEVFLIDDEISLKNALYTFYPGIPQLICIWYINKNVEKEVNKAWKVNAKGALKEENNTNQQLRQ